jgi:hypothetical protein
MRKISFILKTFIDGCSLTNPKEVIQVASAKDKVVAYTTKHEMNVEFSRSKEVFDISGLPVEREVNLMTFTFIDSESGQPCVLPIGQSINQSDEQYWLGLFDLLRAIKRMERKESIRKNIRLFLTGNLRKTQSSKNNEKRK